MSGESSKEVRMLSEEGARKISIREKPEIARMEFEYNLIKVSENFLKVT